MNNQHSSPYPPLLPLPSTPPPLLYRTYRELQIVSVPFPDTQLQIQIQHNLQHLHSDIISIIMNLKNLFLFLSTFFHNLIFFFNSQKLPFYHEDFSQTNTIMLIHTQFSEYQYMFRYNQFTYWIWGVCNNDVKFSLMLLHVFKSITNMQWQFWALKTDGHLWQILFGHLNNFLLEL